LQEIKAILSESSLTLNRWFNRIFDGSLMQAELNAQRGTKIESLIIHNRCKNTKKNCRQVQTSSILNVKDANRHIKARKDREMRRLFVAGQCEAKKRQKVVASNPPLIDLELEENEGGDRVDP
jgi:hypothetical protein